MTRRRCKRAFCLVSQKVLLNHSSVQRKVTLAVLFGAILECAPQMYKSTWSCGLLLRCRTWWSHFFFGKMDLSPMFRKTKKWTLRRMMRMRMMSKSKRPNLQIFFAALSTKKHQPRGTGEFSPRCWPFLMGPMVPSYGSLVRNLKLHSPRSPRSKRLQRSGDGDGSWEIQ